MSDRTEIQMKLYSPRYGREDTYIITLEKDQMKIKNPSNPSDAICKYIEKSNPEWITSKMQIKHPLLDILENDFIFPPTNFINALVFAWLAWRSSELSNEQVEEEITTLSNWVNILSKNHPSTKFWRSKFWG